MGKKVLILSGSPRKGGNSDLLCDEFMRGAMESGNEVEKSELPQKRLLRVLHAIIVKIVENVYIKMIWQKSCKK